MTPTTPKRTQRTSLTGIKLVFTRNGIRIPRCYVPSAIRELFDLPTTQTHLLAIWNDCKESYVAKHKVMIHNGLIVSHKSEGIKAHSDQSAQNPSGEHHADA